MLSRIGRALAAAAFLLGAWPALAAPPANVVPSAPPTASPGGQPASVNDSRIVGAVQSTGGTLTGPLSINLGDPSTTPLTITKPGFIPYQFDYNALGEPGYASNLPGLNTLSIRNDHWNGFSAATFRGIDPFYPNANVTGSISGNVLTVTAVNSGVPIATGMYVTGSGVAGKTLVSSFGTGTGGTGTYNLSNSQTISSEALVLANEFEHGAFGWGNLSVPFDYLEISTFDAKLDRLIPPSEFRLQQTGGVDPTGGIGPLSCSITAGSTAATCISNIGANGTLVYQGDYYNGISSSFPANVGLQPKTTVASGGGTTSFTLSAPATVTNSNIGLSFYNPTYAQRNVLVFTRTGLVYFVNHDNTNNLSMDRIHKRVGIQTGVPFVPLDTVGFAAFGTTTASRQANVGGYVVDVYDPSANQLGLNRFNVGKVGLQINGTSASGRRLDFVDVTSGGGIPLSLAMDGSKTVTIGSLLNLPKLSAAPTAAPGAATGQIFMVAGTNSGTCKLQMMAGTSATPVTIADNVGSGC